jgi:hypothetical protein
MLSTSVSFHQKQIFVIFKLSGVIVHSYNWYLIRSWNQASVKRIPKLVAVLSVTSNHERIHSAAHKPTDDSNYIF